MIFMCISFVHVDSFLLIVLVNEMTIHNEKTIFSSPAEILDSTEHASMSSAPLKSQIHIEVRTIFQGHLSKAANHKVSVHPNWWCS